MKLPIMQCSPSNINFNSVFTAHSSTQREKTSAAGRFVSYLSISMEHNPS
jgi:hypothetical protein